MDIGPVLGSEVGTQTDTIGDYGLEVSKEEFLNLLITQLQMQDPFQPMNNEEMLAQLAQLSSLEQLQNINQGLERNLEMDVLLGQLLNNTLATTLIGRDATAYTNRFHLSAEDDASLNYRLDGYATSVCAAIRDSEGQEVARIEGLDAGEGVQSFVWDGCDSSGRRLPAGEYAFSITAEDAEGNPVSATEMLVGSIEGIRYESGTAWLVLEGTEVYLSDVHEISEG